MSFWNNSVTHSQQSEEFFDVHSCGLKYKGHVSPMNRTCDLWGEKKVQFSVTDREQIKWMDATSPLLFFKTIITLYKLIGF